MLLQSGHHMGVDHVYHASDTSKMSVPPSPHQLHQHQLQQHQQQMQSQPPTILVSDEVTRYLDLVQDTLKDGWTVHATKEGRLYYCK